MRWPIAQTKLGPPHSQAELIARPRLGELLDELGNLRLFLVIAPAGYGKTSLLATWAARTSMKVCWYSIAGPMPDPLLFYGYVIAALQSQLDGFGTESAATLDSLAVQQGTPENLVVTIVNELYDCAHTDFALIIDDYHLVDSSDDINWFVSQLVQYAPDTCHIVLSSRTLITLPDLDLLVARGHVAGIGYEDLAFNREEIQALVEQQFRTHLSSGEILELARVTEGWITGLLLSSQLQEQLSTSRLRTLKATNVDLYAYLARQVLDKQPGHVREFLLRTSLMQEFDANTCADLFRDDPWASGADWHTLVDWVRRNNLFVSEVGTQHIQLRYHSVFQAFLQQRLVREKPQEVGAIVRRLAAVDIDREQWDQVYQLYRLLGDAEAEAELISTYGLHMVRAGRGQLLVSWLEDLPPMVQTGYPYLMAAHGIGLLLTGEPAQGLDLIEQAEAKLRALDDPAMLARTLVHKAVALRLLGSYADSLACGGEVLRIAEAVEQPDRELREVVAHGLHAQGLAAYMMGDADTGIAQLQKAQAAYQLLEDRQNLATVSMDIGLAYLNAGEYRRASVLFERVLDQWRELNNVAGQANVLNNLGFLYYIRGDYTAAAGTLKQALWCAHRSGYRRIEAFALASLGEILEDIAMSAGAAELYQRALDLAQEVDERFLVLYIRLAQARMAWTAADWEGAFEHLRTAEKLTAGEHSIYEWSLYQLAMGRYYLAVGKPEPAVTILTGVTTYLKENGRTLDYAAAQILLAAAYSHQDVAAARHSLELALESLPDSEERHILALASKAVNKDLRHLQAQGDARGLCARLLREAEAFAASIPGMRRVVRQELADLLPATVITRPVVSIRAFGRPEVSVHGVPVRHSDWTTLAARDLFFCLLAHPEGLTKEEIGLLFWPDCATDQVKSRFKNTIYRLRSALPEDVIVLEDDVYRFNRSQDYEYDVELFLSKADAARGANDSTVQLRALEALVNLYRGVYLPQMDALWILSERERLRQIFVRSALDLARIYLVSDRASDALACCQRILIEDPSHEAAHDLAMQVHAALGDRSAVIRQYQLCCQVLKAEIDAEPSQTTVTLYKRLVGEL